MKIIIGQAGPPQMMEMSLFGRVSPELNQYIQQRNQALDHRLQTQYGQAGIAFLQQSQQFYTDYAQSSGMKAAEAMILSGASTSDNSISMNFVPLETLEEVQAAHVRYQPYLMANPVVRALYLENRIEGYVDTYTNTEGSAVGFDQLSFRRVVNGLGSSAYDETWNLEQDEHWVTTTEDNLDHEEPLAFLAQVNIVNAWGIQNAAVAQNLDPSSVDGFEIRPLS